jgi:hypothetical protein
VAASGAPQMGLERSEATACHDVDDYAIRPRMQRTMVRVVSGWGRQCSVAEGLKQRYRARIEARQVSGFHRLPAEHAAGSLSTISFTTSLGIAIGGSQASYAFTMKDETLWIVLPAIGCLVLLASIVLLIGR